MKSQAAVRERYLCDPLLVRLGGLTANLARVKSFSNHPRHGAAVESLIDESKYFIEWAVPDAEADGQAQLVVLQVQLARWQLNWSRIWADPTQLAMVASQSQEWSDRVLAMSGLLD